MVNVEVTDEARTTAQTYGVEKKFDDKIEFLKTNPRHKSLNLKPLKSEKAKKIYSFRIDKKYWGLVIKPGQNSLKVIGVIIHPK